MNVRRGDVLLVFHPFSSGIGGKRRPVLVVQNDADNQRMTNTIVAQITSTLDRAHEPSHFLIEVASPEGRQSGLLHDSVVSCNNLATVHEFRIQMTIGSLSIAAMGKIDGCLKVALGLP